MDTNVQMAVAQPSTKNATTVVLEIILQACALSHRGRDTETTTQLPQTTKDSQGPVLTTVGTAEAVATLNNAHTNLQAVGEGVIPYNRHYNQESIYIDIIETIHMPKDSPAYTSHLTHRINTKKQYTLEMLMLIQSHNFFTLMTEVIT